MLLSCQRSPFGPAAPTRLELMGIRFMVPPPESEGGDPEPKPEPKDDDKKHTDADVARIVKERLERDRREREPKPTDEPKPKPKDGEQPKDAPKVLTQADVDKQIEDALAKKDEALAVERAGDALDKALEGRTFSASLVRSLDVKQFVKDGKTDAAAIKKWVDDNTQEGPKPRPRDPGQGGRDANATAGSVAAGRDMFDNEKPKKKE